MAAITATPLRRKSRYFLVAACLALVVIFIGFLKTFVLPTARGTFTAPAVIYVHGGFLLLWALFLLFQSTLIQTKKIRIHMLIGYFGLVLVVGVVISTMAVGVYVLKRDVALGGGQTAISSLVGVFTSSIIFAILVTAAIKYRRRPKIHKRLMLLAMMAIIWPAFFRFRHYFPNVAYPEVIFGLILPDSMVVIAMLWEKITIGRIHPVYLTAGVALIAENVAEFCLFDSSGWRVVANWLANFFL